MDKARKAKLLELRQKKIANRTQTDSQRHAEFLQAITGLHELFNETAEKNAQTTDELLEKLAEFSSFKSEVADVKKAIDLIPKVDKVAISNIKELIEAQKELDLTDVTKAINALAKQVQDSTVTEVKVNNQDAADYIPVRRVVEVQGRLIFDDKPGGGGGGGGFSVVASVQKELLRETPDGLALAIVNPDGSDISGGGGGSGDQTVYNEIPTGAINGINDNFTTFYNYKPVSLRVYLNGLRQLESSDYIETGANSLEFIATPQIGDSVIIDYIRQ